MLLLVICDVEADPQELNHGQGNKVICLEIAERLKTSVHVNSELRKYSFCKGSLSGVIPRNNVVSSVHFLRRSFAKAFALAYVLALSCSATTGLKCLNCRAERMGYKNVIL